MNYDKFVNSKIYQILDKSYYIIMSNLIFFLLLILGLGVFSFMPSLIAIFLYIYATIINNEKASLFSIFKVFKKEWLKSQLLFLFFLIVGLVLAYNTYYFNYHFSNEATTSLFYAFAFYITIFIDIVLFLALVHSILIYIYFPHLSVKRIIHYSFIFSFSFTLRNIILILISILFTLIIFLFNYSLIFIISLYGLIVLKLFQKPYLKLVKENSYLKLNDY